MDHRRCNFCSCVISPYSDPEEERLAPWIHGYCDLNCMKEDAVLKYKTGRAWWQRHPNKPFRMHPKKRK